MTVTRPGTRTEQIKVRLTAKEKTLIKEAADDAERPMAEFARRVLFAKERPVKLQDRP